MRAKDLFPIAHSADLMPGIFLSETGTSGLLTVPRVARDGRRLLERFFSEVPEPRSSEESFLIHERHLHWVPERWCAAALPYRYVCHAHEYRKGPLLICGAFFPGLFGIEAAKRKIARARAALGPALGEAAGPVRFAFFFSGDGVRREQTHFENELFSAFYDLFGDSAQPMSWNEFLATRDFVGWSFLELGNPAICGDSFLSQKLLSTGAKPLLPSYQGIQEVSPEEMRRMIPLSAHHGLKVLKNAAGVFEAWRRSSPAYRAATYGWSVGGTRATSDHAST